MRVLVAEDEAVSQRVLERTLTGWGYEVIVCSDGAEAWDALQSEKTPELAVLDWMMPEVDGLELCRRIRASPELMSTYIVLLTAKDGREDIIRGLNAGADDYVCKPIDSAELRARVRVGERVVDLQNQRIERETMRYVRELESTVTELQRSRRRIVDVQEEGRKAIAEEIHGPVQTKLFMLSIKLMDIVEMIDPSGDEAKSQLSEAIADLDDIRETDIRQLSHRLHPSIIMVGLGAGLRSLRDSYERWVRIDIQIADEVMDMEPAGLSSIPFNVRLGLYRVADEALGNVIKHAAAGRALVRLYVSGTDDMLGLRVEDDGKGFELGAMNEGLGTATMNDYIGALGGLLELDSAPGKGTRILATVPLGGVSDQLAAD